MTRILMVCLGNICRSPLAEGILRSKVSKDQCIVDSAGTAGYHVGDLPDPRSIDVARKHGIDITDQRCRQFKVSDFDAFDMIYVMDNSNYQNVISLARHSDDVAKVRLILDEIGSTSANVPDPYYGGKDGFQDVYNMLDEVCQNIADNLE